MGGRGPAHQERKRFKVTPGISFIRHGVCKMGRVGKCWVRLRGLQGDHGGARDL